MTYQLPALDYAYNALEPHIDAKTMEIHHSKHHQTYIDKVNAALKGTEFDGKPIDQLMAMVSDVPEKIRTVVRNNGGGHANHSLFWKVIGPQGGGRPSGAVAEAITRDLNGFDAFKEALTNAALNQFGSGWAWLALNGRKLVVESTPNQDSPIMVGRIPILGIDVWEHAYYLKYQNKRAEYVQAFFNVINWEEVGRRYENALKG